MDQPAASSAEAAPENAPEGGQPAEAEDKVKPPGFRTRGSVRRRARFLRKARELAYRDLGGLVFDLHRFGQRNDALVMAKLTTLGQIDGELRALERALGESEPVTVLREAGITACPRCAAIHSGEDRFCPRCGLPMSRNVDLPVAGAATSAPAAPAAAGGVAAATQAPATVAQPAVGASSPATAVNVPASPAESTAVRATSRRAPAPGTHSGDEATEIIRPPATGK
ncbi:MAG TPA: zinc ribbon domain-containing protein [Solirubrobacteraceae bacterium]|nr:zinc ribbon domain-containing protein [Solirubrobacteraceae bacterium]